MENHERFPPIGDYALIGDCHAAALVSRSGSINWCCLPRFDAGSAFAALLDREHGGRCTIDPVEKGDWESSREYLDDTLVLETTLQGPSGAFAVLDCMTAGEGERIGDDRELLRVIEGRRGSVELELRIAPRFDYGQVTPWIRRRGQRLHTVVGGNDALIVWCEQELQEDPRHQLIARFSVGAGERVRLSMAYARPELVDGDPPDTPDSELLDARLQETVRWWREWAGGLSLGSRDEPAARRSGIVLKALTYEPTGAIVAAATTSLPEALGKERNWDYRYAWVRDASFSARAFAELGAEQEADAFRAFMMRSAAGHAEELQVLYGVGGERRLQAQVAAGLEGYRESSPVRVGNDASGQRQLDAYGEIVNLIWRWHRRGHSPDDDDWRFLMSVIEHAAEQWEQPDHGIWEWPGDPEHFVHSKVLCWSALDRGLRLAEVCMRRAPVRRWTRVRDEIREAVESRGYDRERGVFLQAFDRPELDAALLLLPTVEFLDWDDERMVRTVAAIREELGAGDGLLYRYRRRDGLGGREGAFLCCSFWLAECLARQGDRDGARSVFDAAVARANDVLLFSEEVDPRSGALLGNFPQALTHLAHIDAAVALASA